MRWESRLGAKNHETEHNGSVSGAPCETAVESDGGRWLGGVDEVLVVAGSCVQQWKARQGVGTKNQNQAAVGWFQAASGPQEMEGGSVRSQATLPK